MMRKQSPYTLRSPPAAKGAFYLAQASFVGRNQSNFEEMGFILYLDSILIPMSLFLMVGYHAYLWHCFKTNPSTTVIGIDSLKRKSWLLSIKEGDEKMSMLAVQSLRNSLMATILTASIAILLDLSLAAVSSNSYSASRIFSSSLLGAQSARICAFRFGTASVLLLASFLCCSMAVGFLVDANFSVNACSELSTATAAAHTHRLLERGFLMAVVGNRALCVSFPVLLWMVGPLAVAFSSLALVWGLYGLDFPGKVIQSEKQSCCLSADHD